MGAEKSKSDHTTENQIQPAADEHAAKKGGADTPKHLEHVPAKAGAEQSASAAQIKDEGKRKKTQKGRDSTSPSESSSSDRKAKRGRGRRRHRRRGNQSSDSDNSKKSKKGRGRSRHQKDREEVEQLRRDVQELKAAKTATPAPDMMARMMAPIHEQTSR